MSVVIYVLSGLLVLAGTTSIVMGMQIVHLEQGWTAIIAGSVAFVGGCVMFGLGAVLDGLRALRPDVAPAVAVDLHAGPYPAPQADPPSPVVTLPPSASVPVEPPPRPRVRPAIRPPLAQVPTMPEPAPEPVDQTPRLDRVESPARVELDPGPDPVNAEAEPTPAFSTADGRIVPSARKRPNFLANFLARTADRGAEGGPASGERDGSVHPVLTPVSDQTATRAPARTSVDLSSGWSEMAEDKSKTDVAVTPARPDDRGTGTREPVVAADADGPRPPPVMAPAMPPAANLPVADTPPPPTVVGRYNAGSASYIMYSNGMIEVETETGTHQFESMQELKTFIERQEKAKA